jgi:hypothetical protein
MAGARDGAGMDGSEMKKYDVLQYLIQKGPGRTELELARAIHGDKACQQGVNTHCSMLVIERKAERRGVGGPGDPCRYWPAEHQSSMAVERCEAAAVGTRCFKIADVASLNGIQEVRVRLPLAPPTQRFDQANLFLRDFSMRFDL